MTLRTNARLAGWAYILYFVAGIAAMLTRERPHAADLLNVVTSFCALTLGVTLWALTRDEDRDIAMLAMLCRVLEAVPGPGELYFAVGSTLFCWLLLRGRMIPVPLAWLGFASSFALVVLLSVQRAGVFELSWSSPTTWFVWLPTLIFELTFAAWLITKGVSVPARALQQE
jgi:hypothetical protein